MDKGAPSYEWRVGLGDWCVEQPLAAAFLLGMLLVALAAWAFASSRERHATPRRLGIALNLLRGLGVLAVCLVVSRLERRPLETQTVPSVVVLLCDASASMALPADNSPEIQAEPRGQIAVTVRDAVDAALSAEHTLSDAIFAGSAAWSDDAPPQANATRIDAAIDSALQRHRGEPLAGIVLLSDGRTDSDTRAAEAAARAKAEGVRLHTISIGPTREKQNTSLLAIDATARVFAGDPFRVVCRLGSNRPDFDRARLRLLITPDADTADGAWREIAAGEAVASGSDEFIYETETPAPPKGAWRLRAELLDPLLGDDPTEIETRLEVIDRKTRVLLLAGGPTRDYRYLRDALGRDESFAFDSLLQSGSDQAGAEAPTPLVAFPAADQLRENYDALACFDPDLSILSDADQRALMQWISSDAGGLLYVAGPIHTADLLRRLTRHPVFKTMPVDFATDRIAWRNDANTEPYRLRIDPGATNEAALRLPAAGAAGWSGFEVFGPPPPSRLKVGAIGLLSYDQDEAIPFYARSRYGAGRVAYLASGEVWRLRSIDPSSFTSFYVETLRWASQGRLLGEGSQGELAFQPESATVGEPVRLTFTRNTPGPPDDAPYQLTLPSGRVVTRSLDRLEDTGSRYEAEDRVLPREPGRYTALLSVAGAEYAAEVMASIAAVESRATTRNDELMHAIARLTGGTFVGIDDSESAEAIAADLLRETPSRSETRVIVGEPDPAFRFAWSALWGSVAALALVLEWSLRRAS